MRSPFSRPLIYLAAALAGICLFQPDFPSSYILAKGSDVQAQKPSDISERWEAELRAGIALTHKGQFAEAIPHFLLARGHVSDEFAAEFNLALCYVGIGTFERAIPILLELKDSGHSTAEVDNLLSQAYIGEGDERDALQAFRQAEQLTPKSESLYMLVAEACVDHKSYDLGAQVLNAGLKNLPNSARLHYERGVIFTFANEPNAAVSDFDLVSKLSPESEISYMAEGQKALLEGNMPEAIKATRIGMEKYPDNFILLTLFGRAVIQSGLRPGQPEFEEARNALEKAVSERPKSGDPQRALGEIYLITGQLDGAITHLEDARALDPSDPSVYSHLAMAYRRKGESQKAEKMLQILARLNREQAEKYRAGGTNHKAGYESSGRPHQDPFMHP